MNSFDMAAETAKRHFLPAAEGAPYFNCAESVLLAGAETLGLVSDAVPRIATAFGGGLSRQGHVCGALTGGLMVIGLAEGRSKNTESRDPSYQAGEELQRRFRAAHGALTCRELTGCDLSTREGQDRFKATNQNDQCCLFVAMAATTAVELVNKPHS